MSVIFDFVEHYYDGSGEYIWIKLLVSLIGAFVGFGGALIIYYKKQKSDKNKEQSKDASEALEKLTYFKILINGTINHIEKQKDNVQAFVTEQEKNLLEIQILKQLASNDIKRLHSLDAHGIYKAYGYYIGKIDKEWIENYKKLYSALDFIDGSLDECLRIFLSNSKNCYKNLIKIKGKIQSLSDMLSFNAMMRAQQFGDRRCDDAAFVFFEGMIKKYGELVDSNAPIEKYDGEILVTILRRIVMEFQDEPYAEELITFSKNARVRINDVKNEMSDVVETFKLFPERVNPCIVILKENLEKLSKVIQIYKKLS